MAFVAVLGFLLLVSLVVQAALGVVGERLGSSVAVTGVSLAASFLLAVFLFGALFRILPARRIPRRDVVFAAVVTAALFFAGQAVIGAVVGGRDLASAYGAAGALVLILLWVFYSAQVVLFGAQLAAARASLPAKKRKS